MVNPKREPSASPTATDDDGVEWDVIPTGGLGDEWDFATEGGGGKDGVGGKLDGHFISTREVDTHGKTASGTATAFLFAPVTDPDRIVFVWGSAEIEKAFAAGDDGTTLIRSGDRVRITYLGERAFTSADGPRRIKQYKVEAAKRG